MSSNQDNRADPLGSGENNAVGSNADEAGNIDSIVSLGFSRSMAEQGLSRGDGTVTSAVEWILGQNPDPSSGAQNIIHEAPTPQDREFEQNRNDFAEGVISADTPEEQTRSADVEFLPSETSSMKAQIGMSSLAHPKAKISIPKEQISSTDMRSLPSETSSMKPQMDESSLERAKAKTSNLKEHIWSADVGSLPSETSSMKPQFPKEQISSADVGSLPSETTSMKPQIDESSLARAKAKANNPKEHIMEGTAGMEEGALVSRHEGSDAPLPEPILVPNQLPEVPDIDKDGVLVKASAGSNGGENPPWVVSSRVDSVARPPFVGKQGVEVAAPQDRRPVSYSCSSAPHSNKEVKKGSAATDSKHGFFEKGNEASKGRGGIQESNSDITGKSSLMPRICDDFGEPASSNLMRVSPAPRPSEGSQGSIVSGSPDVMTADAGIAPTVLDQEDQGRSDGLVVPTAFAVDDIVQAENVVPEDDLAGRKKVSRKCAAYALVVSICVLAAVVLITLGVTGQFGDKSEVGTSSFTPVPTPAPTPVPSSCHETNCWVQMGPELTGPVPGDEFAATVSLATSMPLGQTRVAISAPESHAGGIDSGLVRVYDVVSDDDGVASWRQVGQDIFGLPGDEGLGFISPNGRRLAFGGWLNDGRNGTQGSIGSVHVFELQNSNWTIIGQPIYGEEAKERFGRPVDFSLDGSVIVATARWGAGTGEVRVYSYVDGAWMKKGQSIGSEGADESFGNSVSISHDGNIVCIGADEHTSTNGFQSGLVRVFQFSSGEWVQLGGDVVGEAPDDHFGSRVHLAPDGMAFAVSAPSAMNANGTEKTGMVCVYSFDKESNLWERVGTPIWGSASRDRLKSVSLSHDVGRVAVGSSQAFNDTGYVRVYHFRGGDWQQLGGELVGREETEHFGSALALHGEGNRLVIGGSPDDNLMLNGVVRAYELPWYQDIPDIEGPDPGDRFGNTLNLGMNGGRIAIGIPQRAVGGEEAGSVQVFDIQEDGSLVQVGQEIHGTPGDEVDGFLSENGMRLAVAARWNDGINGTQGSIGKVSVYELGADGNWTLLGSPIYGEAAKDRAGKAVALNADGSIVAVASPIAAGTGQVRVFQYSNNTKEWIKLGSTLDGEAADDQFGWSVALSDDGFILAVGARHNDGGGYESGHVRVFRFESGEYIQIGKDIDGEAEGDGCGKTVSLSSDGMILAASSQGDDENGEDSGKVRVFSFDESQNEWRQFGGNIYGAGAGDELIRAALTSDGNRVATASHKADGETGYVDVYDLVLGEWRRVGRKIWGQKLGENFGWDVSISGDGTRLAVGGPARRADPPIKGVVRLFKLPAVHISKLSGFLQGMP